MNWKTGSKVLYTLTCFRILVFKEAPTVVRADSVPLIGSPKDYEVNKKEDNFPEKLNLQISGGNEEQESPNTPKREPIG